MSDSIGRTIPVSSGRATEKVSAVDSAVHIKRERPRDDSDYEDQVDIAPRRHMAQKSEQITLSLQMVEALVAGELPEEAVKALQAFAPLGDIAAMGEPCRALIKAGKDQIDWPPDMTLEKALYRAVRM